MAQQTQKLKKASAERVRKAKAKAAQTGEIIPVVVFEEEGAKFAAAAVNPDGAVSQGEATYATMAEAKAALAGEPEQPAEPQAPTVEPALAETPEAYDGDRKAY